MFKIAKIPKLEIYKIHYSIYDYHKTLDPTVYIQSWIYHI